MIDPFLIGEHLFSILDGEKTIFVKCDPPPLDFTKPSNSLLSVISKKASIKLPLNDQLDSLVGLLAFLVFCPEKTVVAWDIKPILTYLKYQCKNECYDSLHLGRVYDLKLCEAFMGKDTQPPETWVEAMRRLRPCTENSAAWLVHRKVHVPLATRVLPDMETQGVVDDWRKKTFFPSYSVEGQVHGRMSCHLAFDRTINPHSLDDDQRAVLKPKPPHTVFVQFDYRAMEVAVLQWLSKDPALGAIIENESKDVYEEVFRIVTDSQECSKDERELAKRFFLQVFFGMQPFALSERLGVSKELAQQIIELIGQKFPVAWSWVQAQHDSAKATGRIMDIFGRVREVEEPYLARHFSIAAPAALICLERLVKLYEAIVDKAKLTFSIHDGYLLATNRDSLKDVVRVARKVLEDEIPLCPGMRLRTSCEAGKILSKMVRMY